MKNVLDEPGPSLWIIMPTISGGSEVLLGAKAIWLKVPVVSAVFGVTAVAIWKARALVSLLANLKSGALTDSAMPVGPLKSIA